MRTSQKYLKNILKKSGKGKMTEDIAVVKMLFILLTTYNLILNSFFT